MKNRRFAASARLDDGQLGESLAELHLDQLTGQVAISMTSLPSVRYLTLNVSRTSGWACMSFLTLPT